MWLSLILLLLLLAIAFFQATQGLFSAMLMAVLTICCAALAVGTHEYVAMHWLAPKWRPDFAMALALGTTFGVSLLLLRLAFDAIIRRACLLPSWVDRIGGAACGLVTGWLMVGIIALCVQMVPFSGSFLSYGRIERPDRTLPEGGGDPTPPSAEENDLFLTPDRFAIGFVGLLSDGLFSGPTSLSGTNPDYVQAMGWRNSVPSEVPRYAPPNSITVAGTEVIPSVFRMTPPSMRDTPPEFAEIKPEGGREFRMIRVKLSRQAMGSAKGHLFTLRQFRLVGTEEGDDELRQFYPIATQALYRQDGVNRHVKVEWFRRNDWSLSDTVYSPMQGTDGQVEIVFDLPKGFRPSFLEYKRGARVAVSFELGGAGEAPPPAPPAEETPPSSEGRGGRDRGADASRGGRVRSFTVSGTSFGAALPFKLENYALLKNAEVSRGKLVNGHLLAYADEQDKPKGDAVATLDVPDDKRLLHLNTSTLQTKSTLGGALSFAIKTVQNYIVTDENGNQYQLVGKYAVADVDGRMVIEVQYFKDQAGSIGGVGAFEKIKDRHLGSDGKVVFLYLVEPGVKIVSFSTGGGDARKQDLTEENIVAPK